MAVFEIPLTPQINQALICSIGGVAYNFRLHYLEALDGGWFLDISDLSGNDLVAGIPVVPGVDLVEPYRYLGFAFVLFIYMAGNPAAHPTWEGLGLTSRLYAEL